MISLGILQQDPWVKGLFEDALKKGFSEIIEAPFNCKIKKLNLLMGEVEFENINAMGPGNKWSFSCPLMTLHFSWWGFLKRSRFESDFTFYQSKIKSDIENNNLAIIDPFLALLRAPSYIPIKLKNCKFQQSSLEALEKKTSTCVNLLFSSSTANRNTVITNLNFADGLIKRNEIDYVQKITGNLLIDIPDSKSNNTIKLNVSADLPYLKLKDKRCTLFGAYKELNGTFEFYHNDRTLNAKFNNLKYSSGRLKTDISLTGSIATLTNYLWLADSFDKVTGNSNIEGHIEYENGAFQYKGNCLASNVDFKGIRVNQCLLEIDGDNHKAEGKINIRNLMSIFSTGNWNYSLTDRHLTGQLHLTKNIELPAGIIIKKGNANAFIESYGNDIIVDYDIKLEHSQNGIQVAKGQARLTSPELILTGIFNNSRYSGTANLENSRINSLDYIDGNNNKLIDLKQLNETQVEGSIDYKFIKNLFLYTLKYELQGDGNIEVKAELAPDKILAQLHLKNTNIRIPYAHNVIKDVRCSVSLDWPKQTIDIKDLVIDLHKGKLTSSSSTISFANGDLEHVHIPLNCFNCLVSWKKDFFGMISGMLTINYKNNGYSVCKGLLTLEKSKLRSNLLSGQTQQDFVAAAVQSLSAYKKNLSLDIQLQTREPVIVKTAFLETQAKINGVLGGTLFNPTISGTVELKHGIFGFPYKPLYITSGKIYLLPGQLDDASIELKAKNKVKRYSVDLNVTGTIKQPKISFDSSPNLKKEQIITLLLSGSEQGSLYMAMPNIIMQNMQSLLFGSTDASSKLQRYLKNMLKPLRNVRILPTLKDNLAEGKQVNGAIEIDINDRLRAKVQNNLNLTDETQVEVEYAVSDDISIKGTKDEKGNIGGEVEMKWKF